MVIFGFQKLFHEELLFEGNDWWFQTSGKFFKGKLDLLCLLWYNWKWMIRLGGRFKIWDGGYGHLHSTKPELRFCMRSDPACSVIMGIHNGEDLWQGSQLEIWLIDFRRPTIPQKQFIITIIISLWNMPQKQFIITIIISLWHMDGVAHIDRGRGIWQFF